MRVIHPEILIEIPFDSWPGLGQVHGVSVNRKMGRTAIEKQLEEVERWLVQVRAHRAQLIDALDLLGGASPGA